MAPSSTRAKTSALIEALSGHFDDHHGFICGMTLQRIDGLNADVERLSRQIEELIAPFAAQVRQLDEVTGIGLICAQEIIAETGADMAVFPTAAHLVAWARFCPRAKQSAGKNKGSGATGKGNPWLAAALGEIAGACCRTPTFLGARYRRITKRRGNGRALVAVGNSVPTIVWHLLSDPHTHYQDLGPDFYDRRIGRDRQARNLTRQLERLTGQKVLLQPVN